MQRVQSNRVIPPLVDPKKGILATSGDKTERKKVGIVSAVNFNNQNSVILLSQD